MRVWVPFKAENWPYSELVHPGQSASFQAFPHEGFMKDLRLLVHSYGFLIESLWIGNREVLRDVTGDLFLVEKADAMEKEGLPDRTRLEGYGCQVGNQVRMKVLNWGVEPKKFSATLYGSVPVR